MITKFVHILPSADRSSSFSNHDATSNTATITVVNLALTALFAQETSAIPEDHRNSPQDQHLDSPFWGHIGSAGWTLQGAESRHACEPSVLPLFCPENGSRKIQNQKVKGRWEFEIQRVHPRRFKQQSKKKAQGRHLGPWRTNFHYGRTCPATSQVGDALTAVSP